MTGGVVCFEVFKNVDAAAPARAAEIVGGPKVSLEDASCFRRSMSCFMPVAATGCPQALEASAFINKERILWGGNVPAQQ